MDRPTDPGELSRTRFRLATPADDAALRALLQRNPMRGQISLSFEREPSYFAPAILGADETLTIVAESPEGLLCAGEISYRRCCVNGEPRRVGYLGALRLDSSVAAQHAIVRQGYRFASTLVHSDSVHFTSIVADNQRARRFLEAGLRDIPRYEPIDGFTTFVLPTRCRQSAHNGVRAATPDDRPALLNLFAEHARQRQFSPIARDEQLATGGLIVVTDGDRLIAAAGICDQRAYKQVVVRGYARSLALAKPLLNTMARLTGTPRLPAIGQALQHAYVSPVAFAPGCEDALPILLPALQRQAASLGIALLMVGASHRDPLHGVLKRHPACRRRYESQLYRVDWGDTSLVLDTRPAAPDVASL